MFIAQSDEDEAEQAKQDAISSIEARNREFVSFMVGKIYLLAMEKFTLTALDLWDGYQGDEPSDPRAMGAVFRRASKNGFIKMTARLIKSGRKSDHNKDLRVWESLIYGTQTP